MRLFLKRLQPRWIFIALFVGALMVSLVKVPKFQEINNPHVHDPDLFVQTLMSIGRMFVAYLIALFFSIILGVLAGTDKNRARVILPLADILQSVPLLSFFPTAIYYFMHIGPPKFGIEAAVIFLIFTCQAWNLLFAVYDGVRQIPESTFDAVKACGLGPIARLNRLYLPTAFPRLVDNSNLSWANGWYFLMACEIIALGPLSYRVHGLGSYLARAVELRNWPKFYMGIVVLVAVIVLIDFLVWKPLARFAQHYRFDSDLGSEDSNDDDAISDNLIIFYRNHWLVAPLRWILSLIKKLLVYLEDFSEDKYSPEKSFQAKRAQRVSFIFSVVFWIVFLTFTVWSMLQLYLALSSPHEMSPWVIFHAIFNSGVRILLAYFISLIWILPLTYWLHRHPNQLRYVQTFSQILAGIPATAFFPIIAIIGFQIFQTKQIAVIMMLLTGMQWYLLFNILGGAQNIGSELKLISRSLGLSHPLYLKNVFFPVIMPAFITGSITAIGGGWNALFIAEHINIGGDVYRVFGIGNILAEATFIDGDKNLVAYSVFFMVLFIVALNRIFWQSLYNWAEQKFRLDIS
jgi:NitT/TauT family transport system permease protein